MSSPRELARGYEALAIVCVTTGALAWLWGFFAVQAPSSPWHVNGMPLAIERLALHAWITGLAVFTLARGEAPPRWVLPVTALGAALSLGAQGVSAATDLLGVQVRDLRAGSGAVLAMRVSGGALLGCALVVSVRQRLRARGG